MNKPLVFKTFNEYQLDETLSLSSPVYTIWDEIFFQIRRMWNWVVNTSFSSKILSSQFSSFIDGVLAIYFRMLNLTKYSKDINNKILTKLNENKLINNKLLLNEKLTQNEGVYKNISYYLDLSKKNVINIQKDIKGLNINPTKYIDINDNLIKLVSINSFIENRFTIEGIKEMKESGELIPLLQFTSYHLIKTNYNLVEDIKNLDEIKNNTSLNSKYNKISKKIISITPKKLKRYIIGTTPLILNPRQKQLVKELNKIEKGLNSKFNFNKLNLTTATDDLKKITLKNLYYTNNTLGYGYNSIKDVEEESGFTSEEIEMLSDLKGEDKIEMTIEEKIKIIEDHNKLIDELNISFDAIKMEIKNKSTWVLDGTKFLQSFKSSDKYKKIPGEEVEGNRSEMKKLKKKGYYLDLNTKKVLDFIQKGNTQEIGEIIRRREDLLDNYVELKSEENRNKIKKINELSNHLNGLIQKMKENIDEIEAVKEPEERGRLGENNTWYNLEQIYLYENIITNISKKKRNPLPKVEAEEIIKDIANKVVDGCKRLEEILKEFDTNIKNELNMDLSIPLGLLNKLAFEFINYADNKKIQNIDKKDFDLRKDIDRTFDNDYNFYNLVSNKLDKDIRLGIGIRINEFEYDDYLIIKELNKEECILIGQIKSKNSPMNKNNEGIFICNFMDRVCILKVGKYSLSYNFIEPGNLNADHHIIEDCSNSKPVKKTSLKYDFILMKDVEIYLIKKNNKNYYNLDKYFDRLPYKIRINEIDFNEKGKTTKYKNLDKLKNNFIKGDNINIDLDKK